MARPAGRVKIDRTRVLSKDVMVAKLSGATGATVAAVKHRGKFHFVAPPDLGGVVDDVPADSLTDCMNWSVAVLGEVIESPKKRRKK